MVKKKKKESEAEPDEVDAREREEVPGLLHEPFWSVVGFDGCLASNLTYAEATELVASQSDDEKPGLCIVTNSAAQRIKAGSPLGK